MNWTIEQLLAEHVNVLCYPGSGPSYFLQTTFLDFVGYSFGQGSLSAIMSFTEHQ